MKQLDKNNIKVLWLSSLGGTLEFYDFIIFLFFTSAISYHFFPETLSETWKTINTYGLFAAAYFARPLGGVVMAHFGDKNGRKNMFMLSIMLMVIPTFLLGVMPTFETIGYIAPIALLLVRILQGIAIGGELPGAWVFVSEHTPKHKRGFAIGVLTASVAGGILLGSIVAVCVRLAFPAEVVEEWAFRIPFILGGIFGIISAFLRRYLDETPIFRKIKEQNAQHHFPIKEVIARNKSAIVICMIFTWILTGAVVVMTLTMPKFVGKHLELSELVIVLLQMLVVFGMSSGCVLVGWFCDKVGIIKASSAFSLGLSVSCGVLLWLVYEANITNVGLIVSLYFVCGIFIGVTCLAPIITLKLFPSKIAFSGLSFSYNVAYAVFGGTAPIFVSAAISSAHPFWIACYMIFLGLMGLCATLFLYKARLFDQVYDEHD